MREIKIICVGKIKENYFNEGINDALKEIRSFCPITIRECKDLPTPEGASPAEEEIIKNKEGEAILSAIDKEDYVIALCIDGRHYSSQKWYAHLDRLWQRERGSLTLVIGGSLGLSDQVVGRADEKLSFSAMTFPHQLMRAVLLEQLAAWVKQ